ncbi:aromatic-ring-hydroxylating dioxygenase subunit beta [Alicyclobacillus acidoterrestris]|uniref:3-phenylpropionate/cinnamic acid dioxygenase subunit beta n=1 Tax=Alicyclobacillus acidoterrestris (strain ATCC 49025 / DSM 3922 / CIP 106132 / NCIMB 13137 / GD3B) TaxID=1356854 RepID=T0BQV0_ALIAG|nr:3-phenylpropionate/cinnamic acid dioxygenase subunit beta [Alicyclobacillus acidoterrestris]EPZ42925.1 hypothetical protein N007_14065 [Alicyclobacillus acidoterrestris ATCC 49025]UNO50057.1 3-phenylpropionate/cinnamic acid dioxygenase subunit beta [Alicyclobacillus acidoterrestris]
MKLMTYDDICQFLYTEASLLDTRRYEEWLELLDDSLSYRMPVRVTRDFDEPDDIVNDMTFFDETKRSLTTRVQRFRTTSAWSENPHSRTRHFVSNIVVEPGTSEDEAKVHSYFLIMRSIRDRADVEQMFGERIDIIRRVDNRLQLVERTIYPDQTVLSMLNLSIFI